MHSVLFFSALNLWADQATAMAGHRKINIDHDMLKDAISAGYSKREICDGFAVSRPTLNRIISENEELKARISYSDITDEAIDVLLLEAKLNLPNMGERMIIGFFKGKG